MTLSEFEKRDLELRIQIANYREMNCDNQAQIALNQKEIVRLELQLSKLHHDYVLSETDKTPQRNLQGEVIGNK